MSDTAPPIRVTSRLGIQTPGGSFGSERWMALLEAIGDTQSISAAARAVDLSYKAAWDAVEAMNNLADAPLVVRSKGGKGGGGTRLTERGLALVSAYRAVEEENRRFLESLNARLDPRDLRLLRRLSMRTSARNQLSGVVTRIQRGAVNDEIEMRLSGGETLVAVITRESTEHLGLAIGSEAIALIKAPWVIVGVDEPGQPSLKLSARNCLRGTITRLVPGAVNSEVIIELPGGTALAAIVTNDAVQDLGLAVGTPASAIFKASSVIVGVAT